jgi:hypothetical protein
VAQVRQHPLFREFVGEAMEVAIKRVEPEVPRGAGRSRRLPIPPALAASRTQWADVPAGAWGGRFATPQTRNKPAICRNQDAESPQIANFLEWGR